MYYISDDKEKINILDVKRLLAQTHWANQRSIDLIKKSMENSLCFGVFLKENDKMVAFSRVITDYATFYYVCDVVVDEAHRGNGYGKAMVKHIVNDERLKRLRSLLITRDAKTLYEKYGGFAICNGTVMWR